MCQLAYWQTSLKTSAGVMNVETNAGGLGDVMGALPKALSRRGHRVMVVAPRYGEYAEGWETGVRRQMRVFGGDQQVIMLYAKEHALSACMCSSALCMYTLAVLHLCIACQEDRIAAFLVAHDSFG